MTFTPEESMKAQEEMALLSPEEQSRIRAEQVEAYEASQTALGKIRAYASMAEVQKRFINLLGDRDGRAYVEAIVIAVSANEGLQKCTPKSIMIQAMRAASLKLSVDPALHQAHLVPFGNQATLIVDYHGLVQLSVNTNYYSIPPNVAEVFEGEVVKIDRFSGKVDIDETLKVKGGGVIGWCGYFKAKNGTERWLYMTNEECDAHGEKYNPNGFKNPKGVWSKERDKMRRKTVLRLIVSRWGNFSPQVQNVIRQEEIIDGDTSEMPDDSNIPMPETKPRRSEKELMGEMYGNPSPIPDKLWIEWGLLYARATTQEVPVVDVQRENTTIEDLKAYMAEILPYVIDAERQAES